MNNRRKLIIALGAVPFTAPFGSFSQQPGRVWRIGILVMGNSTSEGQSIDTFVQGLQKLGYTEGNNISFVIRFAEGNPGRLPALAADLVAKNVDIIFTKGTPPTLALKKTTSKIPIVFGTAGDPVGSGLIASLAKPAGNVTGLSVLSPDLAAKRLQLLKEIFPKIARIAIVTGGAQVVQIEETEHAAKGLLLQTLVVQVERREDIKQIAARLKDWHADSLVVLDSTVNLYNRDLLGEFATTTRLPAVAPSKQYAEAGALISYGPLLEANYLRAAAYVDKILKGVKPGDLPVEQPTTFEMVINMRTAKALGVKIPQSVLVQATKVIE